MSTLSGWGGTSVPGREILSEDLEELTARRPPFPLTRGLGRSYGDSALPPPGATRVAGSRLADRILSFDSSTGVLRAEAGLALEKLVRVLLPRCFFPPVTPGTWFVTLGGMVAADVHGKNHHVAGTLGRHVRRLWLRVASGEIVEASREENPDLFRATLGGMGLTGHILEVELELERVPSPWIWTETERIDGIGPFVTALRAAGEEWPMTVGWIDCVVRGDQLGRGLLFKGRWATPDEAPAAPPAPKRRLPFPVHAPGWLLNRFTVAAFNRLYHRQPLRRGIQHPEAFFYPLDAIRHWNRLYGRQGFTQHQAVLPDTGGPEEMAARARRLLERLTSFADGPSASFLCVVKDCGPEGEGLLSFPRPGISVAIDLPVRPGIQSLVDHLNELVLEEGGRVYLAKDAYTRPEDFRAMEGERLAEFERVRRTWDPDGKLGSAQSVRLMGW
jgi:FAD/FMN-containing dehydrogenase